MEDKTLWIVEFNWKRGQFHIEPLRGRLKRNIAQLLYDGKPRNPDWVTIGVTEGVTEAHKYREAFWYRWQESKKGRGES